MAVVKKKTVQIIKNVTIKFAEGLIDEAFLDEFEEFMFSLSEGESREDEFINHVAGQIAQHEEITFIEGLGPVKPTYDINTEIGDYRAIYTVEFDDIEFE